MNSEHRAVVHIALIAAAGLLAVAVTGASALACASLFEEVPQDTSRLWSEMDRQAPRWS